MRVLGEVEQDCLTRPADSVRHSARGASVWGSKPQRRGGSAPASSRRRRRSREPPPPLLFAAVQVWGRPCVTTRAAMVRCTRSPPAPPPRPTGHLAGSHGRSGGAESPLSSGTPAPQARRDVAAAPQSAAEGGGAPTDGAPRSPKCRGAHDLGTPAAKASATGGGAGAVVTTRQASESLSALPPRPPRPQPPSLEPSPTRSPPPAAAVVPPPSRRPPPPHRDASASATPNASGTAKVTVDAAAGPDYSPHVTKNARCRLEGLADGGALVDARTARRRGRLDGCGGGDGGRGGDGRVGGEGGRPGKAAAQGVNAAWRDRMRGQLPARQGSGGEVGRGVRRGTGWRRPKRRLAGAPTNSTMGVEQGRGRKRRSARAGGRGGRNQVQRGAGAGRRA